MAAQMNGTELDVRSPFSRADARRAGIPVKHLTTTRFRKLFYDLYVCADLAVTPVVLASAALRISPLGSHASHFTAAQIWGGVVPDQPMTHVSSPHGRTRSERRGVGSHETRRGSQIVVFQQLRVSSPEQTFIDLATELNLVDMVVLGDSLVAKQRTTTQQIVEAASTWKGKEADWLGARLISCGPAWTPRWRPGFGYSWCWQGCPNRWSTTLSTTRWARGRKGSTCRIPICC